MGASTSEGTSRKVCGRLFRFRFAKCEVRSTVLRCHIRLSLGQRRRGLGAKRGPRQMVQEFRMLVCRPSCSIPIFLLETLGESFH